MRLMRLAKKMDSAVSVFTARMTARISEKPGMKHMKNAKKSHIMLEFSDLKFNMQDQHWIFLSR
jgi:hypothetical protein